MSTIYFTSNADSGTGTLRDVIASANDGDIITYDPAVFTSGPIVIYPATALITANKNLTIDGGELGIVLDGQQANIACLSLSSGSNVITLVNFTIKRFNRTQNGPIYLNSSSSVLNLHRCKIVDNQNNYFGAIYILNGTANLYDSLVTGNNSKQNFSNYAGGIRLGADGYLNLTRSTVIYNTIANVYGGTERQTITDSFVGLSPPAISGETPAEIGFVNPPPADVIPFGEWTAGAWEAFDFRLKPTSAYLTGAAYQSGDLDLLGHPRTGSWGAYDGSWLVAPTTVSASSSVDFLEINSSGTLTLSGADVVLTVSRGTYFSAGGSAVSASRGYIVLPAGETSSGLTLSNVVCAYSGAGASNFAATTSGMTWDAIDSAISVVLEREVSGAWTTIAQTAGTSYSTALAAGSTVRLFDGVQFLTATVQDGGVAPLAFHPFLYYAQTISVDSSPQYFIITEFLLMSQYYNSGETPVLFARVVNSATGAGVDPSTVSAISYTCYKRTFAWSQETREPVEGHEDVTIPTNAILSSVVPPSSDSRWTVDDVGYNFTFEPDTRTYPLFPTPGSYIILVTVRFSDANPAPIQYEITVN